MTFFILLAKKFILLDLCEFKAAHKCHMAAKLLKVSCFENDFDTCGEVYQYEPVRRLKKCFVT
jgi:hypothetical protein